MSQTDSKKVEKDESLRTALNRCFNLNWNKVLVVLNHSLLKPFVGWAVRANSSALQGVDIFLEQTKMTAKKVSLI